MAVEKLPQSTTRPSGAIRISLPASVAYDLDSFQKGIAAVAERLGCPRCASGYDCTFQLERSFVVNEQLEVRPVAAPQDPIPSGAVPLAVARDVTVTLSPGVGGDLERLKQVTARVADRLGCEACCSGFDITFRNELSLVMDQKLQLRDATAVFGG